MSAPTNPQAAATATLSTKANRRGPELVALDAFCGLGGATLGMRQAGAQVAVAVNHWSVAQRLHEHLSPQVPVELQDVHAADWTRYRGHGIQVGWASPSCRPHSRARRRSDRRLKDRATVDRADVPLRMQPFDVIPILDELDLDAMVVENVTDFWNWKFTPGWLETLRCGGYDLHATVLNARFHQPDPTRPDTLAQSRDRLVVVAVKAGMAFDVRDCHPWFTCHGCGHVGPPDQVHRNAQRAIERGEALLGLPRRLGLYATGGWWFRCQGCGNRLQVQTTGVRDVLDLDDVGETYRPGPRSAGRTERYRRGLLALGAEGQHQGVAINYTGGRTHPLHEPVGAITGKDHKSLVTWTGQRPPTSRNFRPDRVAHRPLNLAELARLQGLAPLEVDGISRSDLRLAIGNAVAVPMARDVMAAVSRAVTR